MRVFSIIQILIPATWLTTVALVSPTHADSSTPEVNTTSSLLPLESRSLEARADDGLFHSVSSEINNFDDGSSEQADITDLLGVDFLDGFVDENGDINLPLGVTIFEAMGTTSIGFGSDF